jgi:hypothetical protein
MILVAIASDVKGLNDIHNRICATGAELSIVGMPTTVQRKTEVCAAIPIIKNRVVDLQEGMKLMYALLETLNTSEGFARVYLMK